MTYTEFFRRRRHQRIATTIMFGGLAFGMAALWVWALVGMSREVGAAAFITSVIATAVGSIWRMNLFLAEFDR